MQDMSPIEVKTTRENLGMTQQEFADEIGAAKETVNRWENGASPVSKGFIKAIEKL